MRDIGNSGSVMPAMCLAIDAAIRRVAVIACNPRPHSHRRGQQHLVTALYAGLDRYIVSWGLRGLAGRKIETATCGHQGMGGGGGGGGGEGERVEIVTKTHIFTSRGLKSVYISLPIFHIFFFH